MKNRKDPGSHTTRLLKPVNQGNPDYHKGENCIIERSILCQEGYCSRCWIHKQHDRNDQTTKTLSN
jgi:hypothetical protein